MFPSSNRTPPGVGTWPGPAVVLSALALFFACGCLGPAKSEAMVPRTDTLSVKRQRGSISVSVVDAREVKPDKLFVTPDGFKAALEQSIQKSGLFESVTEGSGDYELKVGIVRLTRDTGLDAVAALATRWTLHRHGEDQPMLDEIITKSYTASLSEAFSADTRQRKANEGVARDVIKAALERISSLTL